MLSRGVIEHHGSAESCLLLFDSGFHIIQSMDDLLLRAFRHIFS